VGINTNYSKCSLIDEDKNQIGLVFQMMFDSFAKCNDEASQDCMTQTISFCCGSGKIV